MLAVSTTRGVLTDVPSQRDHVLKERNLMPTYSSVCTTRAHVTLCLNSSRRINYQRYANNYVQVVETDMRVQ